jgi:hypothetical protein
MPQPFLDCLPSECSPREDRVPLSGPLASFGYLPRTRERTVRTLSPLVSLTPTSETQSPCSASDYGLNFHRPKSAFRSPWVTFSGVAPYLPASPASKRCSLCRIRSRRTGLPRHDGRYSLGLLPLQRPNLPSLGSSNPSAPQGTNTDLHPEAPVNGSRERHPPKPGET